MQVLFLWVYSLFCTFATIFVQGPAAWNKSFTAYFVHLQPALERGLTWVGVDGNLKTLHIIIQNIYEEMVSDFCLPVFAVFLS